MGEGRRGCEGRPSQETGWLEVGAVNAVGGLREGGRWSGSRKESGLRWWAGLEAAVVVKAERWRGGGLWVVACGRASSGLGVGTN